MRRALAQTNPGPRWERWLHKTPIPRALFRAQAPCPQRSAGLPERNLNFLTPISSQLSHT